MTVRNATSVLISLLLFPQFAHADFLYDFAIEEAPATKSGAPDDYILDSGDASPVQSTKKSLPERDDRGRALAPDPTASETLETIKLLYNNQECWVHNGSQYRYFKFSYGPKHVSFAWTWWYWPRQEDKWSSFNPADVTCTESVSTKSLNIKCNDGRDCISNQRRSVSDHYIGFCEPDKAKRICKALDYLKKYYPASRPLPF